jgi:hypothetical protein
LPTNAYQQKLQVLNGDVHDARVLFDRTDTDMAQHQSIVEGGGVYPFELILRELDVTITKLLPPSELLVDLIANEAEQTHHRNRHRLASMSWISGVLYILALPSLLPDTCSG